MFRCIFAAFFLLSAPLATAGEIEDTLIAAVALACAEDAGDAAAMAAALPGGATALADEPTTMGEEVFGWRRDFALGAAAVLRVTRLAPWGTLRRIEVDYASVTGGAARPEAAVIAGPDCRVRDARRLIYDAAGTAEAIEILDAALAPTGEREPLNPPVPNGTDPGGVTVALVDSGVNYLLPAIAAALARDVSGRALGYDYWDLDDRPFDANPARSPFFPERHGTRVASAILREAPDVRLVVYRYPRPDPSRWAELVDAAAAVGARIVNLAMGSNRTSDWDVFAQAASDHGDILFVVSAGNNGRDLDRKPVYPAAYAIDNMIVVGSADGFGQPAPGSNWGKATVDILTPGEHVPVTDFHGRAAIGSGSSFAVPRVTALAARLAAANPDWRAAELKLALIARSRMIDGAGPLTTRYGLLDPDHYRNDL